MTKAELRREMRQRLLKLDADHADKSAAITTAIATHPAFVRGTRIALFSPLPGEPDVRRLCGDGLRRFCFPRVVGTGIEFLEVADPYRLVAAAWNPRVLEPAADEARIVAPAEIDLVLVPGLAFARDGGRLGRGGGFYDRFLARLPGHAAKFGVCFDCQLVAALPIEAHDQHVDAIFTESGLTEPSH